MKKNKRNDFKTFIHYYKPHSGLLVADLICATMIAVIDIIFPIATRYSIQNLLPSNQYTPFFVLIIGLFVLYIFKAGLQYFVTYKGHVLGVRMEADMRRDVFSHLQRLSFGFYDKTRTGHLMSRVIGDLFEISELAHHGPEDILTSVLTFVGSVIVMLFIQWKLAIVLFLFVPVVVIFLMRQRRLMGEVSRDVKSKIAVVNADLESSISGIRVSQAFSNEDYEIEKFQRGNESFKLSKTRYYRAMGLFFSGIEGFTSILNVAALSTGGYLIMRGEMQAIELLTFTLYISTFLTPIRKISNFMEQYTAGMAGFQRMQELMHVEAEIVDKPGAYDIENVKGGITFENVTFAYDQGENVLSGINLSIGAGKVLALVGPSGGGKSTLCQLILRFYEPQSGTIRLDGVDISEITLNSLREQVGIVQQDVFLFADSIRENILYGKHDATEEEMIAAAKRAEIHDFIMSLPDGYDTNVGERGVMLSGGQKQRISIARIFLKNPPVLILDEATSALDSVTERRIQSSLDELSKGRTTLVIAHRLSTIKNADEIIFVDSSGILERGSHSELMEIGGEYSELYRTQFMSQQ